VTRNDTSSGATGWFIVAVLCIVVLFAAGLVVVGASSTGLLGGPADDGTNTTPVVSGSAGSEETASVSGETASASGGDADDSRANATRIETGESVEGSLPPADDADWYAVNATAGEALLARLRLPNETEGRSVSVHLYGPGGEQVTERQHDGLPGPLYIAGRGPKGMQDNTAEAPDVAEVNATYYIRVKSTRYAEPRTDCYCYGLTVAAVDLDSSEPNENGPTATRLALNESVDAAIAPYDHDVYAVNLTAGAEYTVTYEGLDSEDEDVFTKQLRFGTNASNASYDTRDRMEYTGAETFGRERTVTIEAQESGTHYLLVAQSDVNAQLLERDGYRLTVTRTDSASGEESGENGTDDSSG